MLNSVLPGTSVYQFFNDVVFNLLVYDSVARNYIFTHAVESNSGIEVEQFMKQWNCKLDDGSVVERSPTGKITSDLWTSTVYRL